MEMFKTEEAPECSLKISTNVLKHLVKEIVDLKSRLAKLENSETKKTKKNIMDVFVNRIPSCDFAEWCAQPITENDFDNLNHLSYKESMLKAVQNKTSKKHEDSNTRPLVAFTEIKNNTIYIYKKKTEEEGFKWQPMEKDDIKKLISSLDNEFNRYYFEWSDKNKDNPKMQENIIHCLEMIDSTKVSTDHVFSQTRKIIYESIQISYDDIPK
jgi:hypothetical protein